MKYEDYAGFAENATAENAMETIKNIMAKVHEDCLAYDAEMAANKEALEAKQHKLDEAYHDYNVLYNTTRGAQVTQPEEEEEDLEAKQLEEIETNILSGLKYV